VILQGLVDARYKFLSVDVGAYDRQIDSGVFSKSNLYQHLESGSFPFPHPKQIPWTTTKLPHVILGDQGYPLKDCLMLLIIQKMQQFVVKLNCITIGILEPDER